MGINRNYIRSVKSDQGYLPTWDTSISAQLGDVISMDDNGYVLATTLKKLGIDMETRPGHLQEQKIFQSKKSVSVQVKLSGSAPLPSVPLSQADAGIAVKFDKADSYVICLENTRTNIIANLAEIADQIKPLIESDKWKPEYRLVSQVMETSRGTVLLSSQADTNATVKFAAQALPVGTAPKGDAEVGVEVSASVGVTANAANGLQPLFMATQFKIGFFSGKIKFMSAGEGDEEGGESDGEEGVLYEDVNDYD